MAAKSFLSSRTFFAKEIEGETLKFYPVSYEVACRLSGLAEPIAVAFSTLLLGQERDVGEVEKVRKSGADDYERETVTAPIDPKLAEMRLGAQNKAIGDLVRALTSPANGDAAARIIIDSLRDEFPRGEPAKETIAEVRRADLGRLGELLLGVLEANKGALGPFALLLPALRTGRLEGLLTPGSNSTSPSSESSEPASLPAGPST